MATINIKGERFTSIYDNIRVRWGLPQGAEHARVMREAAFHVVSQDARKGESRPRKVCLNLRPLPLVKQGQ